MVGKWHLGHTDQKYCRRTGASIILRQRDGEVDYFTKKRSGVMTGSATVNF